MDRPQARAPRLGRNARDVLVFPLPRASPARATERLSRSELSSLSARQSRTGQGGLGADRRERRRRAALSDRALLRRHALVLGGELLPHPQALAPQPGLGTGAHSVAL